MANENSEKHVKSNEKFMQIPKKILVVSGTLLTITDRVNLTNLSRYCRLDER